MIAYVLHNSIFNFLLSILISILIVQINLKILRIFSKFFINFLVLHFLIVTKMRKYSIKKFWKNS